MRKGEIYIYVCGQGRTQFYETLVNYSIFHSAKFEQMITRQQILINGTAVTNIVIARFNYTSHIYLFFGYADYFQWI